MSNSVPGEDVSATEHQADNFLWKPIYVEIADRLLHFRNSNHELVSLLAQMHQQGLKAVSITDKDEAGDQLVLGEIDPFTFLANLNRGVTVPNRIALFQFLKEAWGLKSELPMSFDAIPLANLQNSWYMPYKVARTAQHVPTLWDFYEQILEVDHASLDTDLFDRCTSLSHVGLANLTMGMFWARPDRWIALDKKNVAFATKLGAGNKPRSGGEYLKWIASLRNVYSGHIASFSLKAHLEAVDPIDQLAAPFDLLFRDSAHADTVFDRFAAIIEAFTGEKSESDIAADSLLCMNLQRWSGRRVRLRLIYAKWAVFGFRFFAGECAYQVVLPVEHWLVEKLERVFRFTEEIDGTRYVLGWISESRFDDIYEELLPDIVEAAVAIRNQFSHWKASPYASKHIPELVTMAVDPDARPALLEQGLQDIPDDDIPSSETTYWLMAPGRGATLWESWLNDNVITIGWDEVGSLDDFDSSDEVASAISEAFPESGPRKVGGMLWAFSHEMKTGDVVFAKKGRYGVLGWGVVSGDYIFDDLKDHHKHVRPIEWRSKQETPMPEGDVLAIKTLTQMSGKQSFLNVMALAYEDVPGLIPPDPIDRPQRTAEHWWLNANPKIWDPGEAPLHHEEWYSSLSDDGKPRRMSQAFQQVQPGDPVLLYVTSPQRYLWGQGTITKGLAETDDDRIWFRLEERFPQPVPLERMKAETALGQCVPLVQPQGSLFPLTDSQYEILMKLGADSSQHPMGIGKPYAKSDALQDLFLSEEKLDRIIDLLRKKKNVILQGAPGTGKTFVARRLAYLLMEQADESRAPMVQFHQSTTYEDFIQGYRPDSKGNFKLKNGAFFEFCRRAILHPKLPFVFIIDEINRGNLSKVFGELMMLIESDKRRPSYALPLMYAEHADETFYVPPNVHLIGTMNTADRSLSLVDYALRRRFAFVELDPEFDSPVFESTLAKAGATATLIEEIRKRMNSLNHRISEDTSSLGRGYRIGHSFFVPTDGVVPNEQWLNDIIHYEILPLVDEYWIDDVKHRDTAMRIARGE